jgi:hypothetical protein
VRARTRVTGCTCEAQHWVGNSQLLLVELNLLMCAAPNRCVCWYRSLTCAAVAGNCLQLLST